MYFLFVSSFLFSHSNIQILPAMPSIPLAAAAAHVSYARRRIL